MISLNSVIEIVEITRPELCEVALMIFSFSINHPLYLLGSKNKPKLYVQSGDTVSVEMVTHHAGDYYDGNEKRLIGVLWS